MIERKQWTLFVLLLAWSRIANAGQRSPDQVLLIFNANSPVSKAIANDYASKRHVTNMLSIRCKDSAISTENESISWGGYQQSIETPVREYLAVHTNIDFIVLTKGVPIRITGAPMGSSDQINGFNYSGQGAYFDPSHNYWNPVKLEGTTFGVRLSDGTTASPVTLTDASADNYDGEQGERNTPAGLESPYALEKNDSVATDILNNVPPGAYCLYLYGKNDDVDYADRGTFFTVSVGDTSYGTQRTVNTVTTSFTEGDDYIVFTNITVRQAGSITFTYTANVAATRVHNPQSEGDFNGLQLVSFDGKVVNFDVAVLKRLIQIVVRDALRLIAPWRHWIIRIFPEL